jgi:hypothetical protein
MKGFLFAILLGVAIGYALGYRDADAGRPHAGKRIADKFGVERVRHASTAREELISAETR